MKYAYIPLLAALLLGTGAPLAAQSTAPSLIPLQAYLADDEGVPV
jgi:hypothetical protein